MLKYFFLIAAGCITLTELDTYASVEQPTEIISGKVRTIEVSDMVQLREAIKSAQPGDAIVMADGKWKDADINFNARGLSGAPVTLKAKTPGNVLLTGASKLVFSAPHLVADGLLFTEGTVSSSSVIEFKSDHCRLTNSAIVDYNPSSLSKGYYWIFFSGNYNRVDHCYFKGKNNMQPLVGNNQDNSRYNKVDYCYFGDIPFTPDNGREIFRIWGYGRSEETGDDGAFFTIEYNLFEKAHGEGVEIISLKSNRNTVRYNTIRSTRGGIVGRSGNFNTIEGNFIFGDYENGSTGIRVAGQGHRVINNYITEVDGEGLILICGEYIDKPLTPAYQPILREGTPLGRVPRYGHVKNGVFAHNTLINNKGIDITIGASYKPELGAEQRILIPENNQINNNLIYKTNGGVAISSAVQDIRVPLDIFKFQPNNFSGNLVYGGKIELNGQISGIKTTDPLLVKSKDGLYRPSAKSPVIDASTGNMLKEDIEGHLRNGKADIGADEVSSKQPLRQPLTADKVGPAWVIRKRAEGNMLFR